MQTNSFVLRSVDESPSSRRRSTARRGVAYVLLGLMATLFLSFNPFTINTSSSGAYAYNWLDPCGNADESDQPSLDAWPGSGIDFLRNDPSIPLTNDSNQLTALEWYGTAGMKDKYYGAWDSLEIEEACTLTDRFRSGFALEVMSAAYDASNVAMQGISLGLSTSFTTNFLVGEDDGIISSVIKGFQNGLYQNYLLPVVMLAALWIGWQGIVKRRGTEAIQGTTWTILAAVAAAAFFIWPVEIARTADNAVGAVGSTIVSAMASNGTSETGLCSLPEFAPEREIRTVKCGLWYTFVYKPWANTQFGPAAQNTMSTNGADITFRPGASSEVPISLYFLDTKTINLAEVRGEGNRSQSARSSQWNTFVDEFKSDSNESGWAHFAGVKGATLGDAFVSWIALGFALIPMVFFSLTLVLQQVTFILLMLVAPLFLLAGLVPGAGRRMLLGWLELTASTVIKRIVTYVMAGLLLTAIGIIASSGDGRTSAAYGVGAVGGTILQIVMIAVAGVATVFLRKKILDQYGTVNLGGDPGLINATNETMQRGQQNVTERIRGSVTAPVTAAANTRAEGKSMGESLKAAGGAFGQNLRARGSSASLGDAARAVGKANTNYKFASTMREKQDELKRLKAQKQQNDVENKWMRNGELTASEWKEYSASNGGRAVPRPKNNQFASELLEAGVPMRSPVDVQLETELATLQREIDEFEKLAERGSVSAGKTARVNREQQRRRDEQYQYDFDDEYGEAGDNTPESSAPAEEQTVQPEPTAIEVELPQTPTRPGARSGNPYARGQVFKNRQANRAPKSEEE